MTNSHTELLPINSLTNRQLSNYAIENTARGEKPRSVIPENGPRGPEAKSHGADGYRSPKVKNHSAQPQGEKPGSTNTGAQGDAGKKASTARRSAPRR